MSKGTELRREILADCDEYGLWSPETMEPSLVDYFVAEAIACSMVEAGELIYLKADLSVFCRVGDLWKFRALGIVVDLPLADGRVVTNVLDEDMISFGVPRWSKWLG